jgi:hypothetical protein
VENSGPAKAGAAKVDAYSRDRDRAKVSASDNPLSQIAVFKAPKNA